jgi:ParB-like chromosome segregation protein Spo0J
MDANSSREFHPASMIFPMMDDESIETLAEDIRLHGLMEDIVLADDGRIADGRNRQVACLIAGVKPRYKTLADGVSPIQYVISENLHRRHLTKSQQATCAVEALPLLEEEAKERQATSTGGKQPQLKEKLPEADLGQSRDAAGELFGVSGKYVSDAKAIKDESPELFEKVKNKELTLQDAKRELKTEQSQKQAEETPWPDRDLKLKAKAIAGKAVVVNISKDHHIVAWARSKGLLVMVDRSSPWGNPFYLHDDGDRDEVCDSYADFYLPHKPSLLKQLKSLKGKVLACHCAPERCHADAIAEAANANR